MRVKNMDAAVIEPAPELKKEPNRAATGRHHHQLGPGNNLALRLSVLQDHTPCDYVLDGEQHPNFEATLPEEGL